VRIKAVWIEASFWPWWAASLAVFFVTLAARSSERLDDMTASVIIAVLIVLGIAAGIVRSALRRRLAARENDPVAVQRTVNSR
jgi:hypothetical protein